MPYTNDPANSATDRVRLLVGDIWPDIEMLTDNDYQYYLDKYGGKENRAAIDAARAILFKLARLTRERTGDIEVYGSEWFKNYKAALELMIKNPDLTLSTLMPYAGGISKSDMCSNDSNPDNVTRDIFIGFTEGKKLYEKNVVLELNEDTAFVA
ncbi:hypothetical protein D3C85_607420 [compost metagenome]